MRTNLIVVCCVMTFALFLTSCEKEGPDSEVAIDLIVEEFPEAKKKLWKPLVPLPKAFKTAIWIN